MDTKKIGHILAHTLTVYKNNIAAALKENMIELSIEQFGILLLINREGLSTQQYIANELYKDKSAVLRQINILIKKKLVKKVTCPGDKRFKRLVLTSGGNGLIAKIREISIKVETNLLRNVNRESLDTAIGVLYAIQENGRSKPDLFSSSHIDKNE